MRVLPLLSTIVALVIRSMPTHCALNFPVVVVVFMAAIRQLYFALGVLFIQAMPMIIYHQVSGAAVHFMVNVMMLVCQVALPDLLLAVLSYVLLPVSATLPGAVMEKVRGQVRTEAEEHVGHGDGTLHTLVHVFATSLFLWACVSECQVKGAVVQGAPTVSKRYGNLMDDHSWGTMRAALANAEISGVVFAPPSGTYSSNDTDALPALRGSGRAW